MSYPKRITKAFFDIPKERIAYLHRITKSIASAVEKATKADGISIIQQNGKASGQDIFHLHVHVIPRYEGQKLPSFSEISDVDRKNLSKTAEKIRKYL